MKAPLLVACLACTVGCSISEHSPAQQGSARSGTTAPAAPSPDWSAIEPATDGSEIRAYKTIARHADAWYHGRKQTIELAFQPGGFAADRAGHRVAVTAQEWKGIIARARAAPPEDPLVALASRAEMYSGANPRLPRDSFGEVPRHLYSIQVLGDGTLRLRNLGPYEEHPVICPPAADPG
jgi:hypothetical protein